jgi:hypothetical protein
MEQSEYRCNFLDGLIFHFLWISLPGEVLPRWSCSFCFLSCVLGNDMALCISVLAALALCWLSWSKLWSKYLSTRVGFLYTSTLILSSSRDTSAPRNLRTRNAKETWNKSNQFGNWWACAILAKQYPKPVWHVFTDRYW